MEVPIVRELASQRSIALYNDQEEKIQKLATALGKKITYADLARKGVDIIIETMAREAKKRGITWEEMQVEQGQ